MGVVGKPDLVFRLTHNGLGIAHALLGMQRTCIHRGLAACSNCIQVLSRKIV